MEVNDKRAQGKEVNVHTHKTSALIKRSYEIELHERTQSHIYDGAFSSIAKRCLTWSWVLIAPLIESLYRKIQSKGPSLVSPNLAFHFVATALATNLV